MTCQTTHNHSPPLTPEAAIAPDINQLAIAHGRAVFAVAYRVLGDAGMAEDVQQNVFMRLLERPPSQDIDNWSAYLGAMATRAAIDELRRRQRWQRIAETFRLTESAEVELPADAMDDLLRAKRLRQALARLPKRQAECFALRFFHGQSPGEIASTLAVSSNVVSVALNRATASLRSHVEALESSAATANQSGS